MFPSYRFIRLGIIVFLAVAVAPVAAFAATDSIQSGSWTLAILPDTQKYAQSLPNSFTAQTQWIKNHKASHNIQYTVHLGDVVNNNTNLTQWNRAKASMDVLNNVVPYAIAPGNHDYGSNDNANNRNTSFNNPAYFGTGSSYAAQSSVGGFFETGKTDNSYHTFRVDNQDWLILALEFGPRDAVVDWADQIVAAHPNHNAILVTHAYMYYDDTRYDWAAKGTSQDWSPYIYGVSNIPGGINDGQQLWDKLISKHDNFRLVLNGHVLGDGTGYLASVTDGGAVVHQMLSNYQFLSNGGEGYLRYLEFTPQGSQTTVTVRTYSPVLDLHDRSSDQQFTFSIVPVPEPSPVLLGIIGGIGVYFFKNINVRISLTSNHG